MADMPTLVRRLRNLVNDRPYGFSVSAIGAATDLTHLTTGGFNLVFGSGISSTISINPLLFPTLNTGPKIAAAMQSAIRAAQPATPNYALAKVLYKDGQYVIQSGAFGSDSSIAVTPADSADITATLLLGVMYEGEEYFEPTPRYSDEEIQEALLFGLSLWNGVTTDPTMVICDLTSAPDLVVTLVMYYAWRYLLEHDAGSTAFSFRQTLGGDTLSLGDMHKNILDLLRYLSDRIKALLDELNIATITVGTLTRYDREQDERTPTYMRNNMPIPRFLQLVRVDATTVLVEWQEFRIRDFATVSVYSATASPMLDRALLNAQGVTTGHGNGIIPSAVRKVYTSSPINTVARVTGLSPNIWNFVIVVCDTRGDYFYSDEYALDLSDIHATPVLTVVNNRSPNSIATMPCSPITPPAPVVPVVPYPTAIAGVPIMSNSAVFIHDDGYVYPADNNDPRLTTAAVFLAYNSVNAGETVYLMGESELVFEAAWTWVPGNRIYAGSNGILTQTAPTTGVIAAVAIAISVTQLRIEILTPIVLAP